MSPFFFLGYFRGGHVSYLSLFFFFYDSFSRFLLFLWWKKKGKSGQRGSLFFLCNSFRKPKTVYHASNLYSRSRLSCYFFLGVAVFRSYFHFFKSPCHICSIFFLLSSTFLNARRSAPTRSFFFFAFLSHYLGSWDDGPFDTHCTSLSHTHSHLVLLFTCNSVGFTACI